MEIMETMEIYNNTSNGKDLAEKYRYPTINVDNIKAIGTDPYDIPDRDLPPVLIRIPLPRDQSPRYRHCRRGSRILLRQIIMMI